MSFFNSTPPTSYKPQVRVEGFHLPSPGTPPGGSSATNPGGTNSGTNSTTNGNGLNDLFPPFDPFRKFPAGSGEDFNDDLVSLMTDRNSGNGGNGNGGNGNIGAGAGSAGGGAYDEGYHRTHNIFDVSSPIPVNSNHNATTNGPGSQPSSLHSPSTSLHDYHNHPPPHFNSTLPALNSSMRYEPPPENNPLTPSSPQVPPSSYHAPNGFTRHTPSPIHAQGAVTGRARSHSRPPSSGGVASSLNTGGIGPARTTRTRRGNSMSGPSPPPIQGRPHAIMIPGGGHRNSHSGVSGGPMSAGANPPNGNPWFMGQGANQNSNDYLPTPESLGSHSLHSHHHSHSGSGFGPFSLSPPQGAASTPGEHLPPLHHMGHSLPKSPMEQHLPHHQHHPSLPGGLPKSPLEQPYGSSYGFGNPNMNGGGSPPGGTPGSLPNSLGGGIGNANGMGIVASPPIGGVTPTGSSYGMSTMTMTMGLPGSAPGNGVSPPSLGSNGAILANEKRRRRRESHNAVERRRRDNINEKISELATLIPECMLDGTTPPNAKDPGTSITPPITEDALVPKSIREKANGSDDGALKQEKEDDGTSLLTGDGQVVKANKGMILRKSVEYIRYLQQLVTAQGARNRELEQELRKFRGSSVSSDSQSENTGEGSTNADDTFDNDDNMSLAFEGEMVLADEAMATPNANASNGKDSSPTATKATPATKGRKGHQKHPSITRPKPPRLPSMPEEELDMEIDKASNVGDGSSSPSDEGHGGEKEGSSARGRTRGVRAMGGSKEDGDQNGQHHEQGQGHQDHDMGMEMFGMINSHGHHQQYQHSQQHVMSW